MSQDSFPPREPTRMCYYMQTHKEPGQIVRLVRTIKEGSPGSIVLIDHDVSAEPLDRSLFDGMSDIYFMAPPAVTVTSHILTGSWPPSTGLMIMACTSTGCKT